MRLLNDIVLFPRKELTEMQIFRIQHTSYVDLVGGLWFRSFSTCYIYSSLSHIWLIFQLFTQLLICLQVQSEQLSRCWKHDDT